MNILRKIKQWYQRYKREKIANKRVNRLLLKETKKFYGWNKWWKISLPDFKEDEHPLPPSIMTPPPPKGWFKKTI